ncbi:MAG: phosphate-starvation-inducible PsiE family protein [Candidatus Pacebacteria bacterium]|nr:phosphate-starvation-inducible PsiE family protein [Candidatus Paceibacterota bacterium]
MEKCDYEKKHGKFLCWLHDVIIVSVKVLAVLTVFMIILGVFNAGYIIYASLLASGLVLTLTDFFNIFGELLTVLIAIEIFQNIIMYIRTDKIPIKLVLATAIIAVARKFIVIGQQELSFYYILGLAISVIALSFSFWLLRKPEQEYIGD